MALTTSVALVLVCLKRPDACSILMIFILPILIMLIGITSPQRGSQLDATKHWYLLFLMKSWGFSALGLMVLLLLAITSLFLPDRHLRMLEGDFRSYRVQISIQSDTYPSSLPTDLGIAQGRS